VFDKPSGKWAAWVKTAPEVPIPDNAQYTDIIVPTVDTIRYTFLIDVFVQGRINFLFVGPTGTGKTSYIKRHVRAVADQEDSQWVYLFMYVPRRPSQIIDDYWADYGPTVYSYTWPERLTLSFTYRKELLGANQREPNPGRGRREAR